MEEGNYYFEFYCDTILRRLESRSWYYISEIAEYMPHLKREGLVKILLYLEEERQFISRNQPLNNNNIKTAIDTIPIRITSKGTGFIKNTSFLEERENKDLEAILREQSYTKGKQDIELNAWFLKTKQIPFIISGGSLIVSIVSIVLSVIWHNADKSQLTIQQEQITDLQLRLKETKNEFYNQYDNLLKKEHISKSVKMN